MFKVRRVRRIGFQAFLLRIALVSLPVILILSVLATVVKAADGPDMNLTIRYHGKTTSVAAKGGTVGELLSQLGLELTGEDVVTPGMEDSLEPDLVITINEVVEREEVYTRTLAYAVTDCWDPSLPKGTEAVLVKGKEGELRCRAKVTYVNGQERSREVLQQDVVTPAVTEVIARGTGAEADRQEETGLVIADGYITLPTGEVLTYTESKTMTASAYSHMDPGCDSITATGTWVHWGTVAVNPKYIPYGTRMFIVAGDFVYGIGCAEDLGGGKDKIDLYMPTYNECIRFGRQECTVYFLG